MIRAELENSTLVDDAAHGCPPAETVAIDPNDVVSAFSRPLEPLDCQVVAIPPSRQTPVLTAPCPVCGCQSARPRYAVEGDEFSLVACVECGLGQVHPRPTPQRIQSFYPAEYYGASGEKFVPLIECAVRRAASLQAARLTRGLPTRSRVLDVGCGRGTLLAALSARGYEAHGFDISTTALEGNDANTTVHVADSLTEARLPDNHFDQVVLWHVLEHLPNPRETLTEIRRILKPGGRIAVAVPNFASWQSKWSGPAWFHLDLPRHLFHFSTDCLRRMMNDAGFDVEAERHFSLRQNPFGWVQSAMNRCDSRNRNWLYSLLKRRTQQNDTQPARMARWFQKLAYWLGMPIGLGISCLAAACRSGATICLTGRVKAEPRAEFASRSAAHAAGLDRLAETHRASFPPADSEYVVDNALSS